MFQSMKRPLHVEGPGAALRTNIKDVYRTVIDQAGKLAFSTAVKWSCGVIFATIEVPMRQYAGQLV